MVKKLIATSILVAALTTRVFAAPGDNDFGRNSNFEHPKTSINWNDFNVLTEFNYTSQRPDSENGKALGGVIHTYEILKDGNNLLIREKGKDVLVGMMPYWDINQDNKRGQIEKEARNNGYLTDFTTGGNESLTNEFYTALLGALEDSHDKDSFEMFEKGYAQGQKTNDLEKLTGGYPNISFLIGGFVGHDNRHGTFGGTEGGLQLDITPYFGIDLLGRMAFGGKSILEKKSTTPSSSGLYGEGMKTQEQFYMPGIALNLKVGKDFYVTAGTGVNFPISNGTTEESIKRGDNILKVNQSFFNDSNVTLDARLGVGYTFDNGWGVNATYSGNFQDRNSVSLKAVIPTGKTREQRGLLRK